jgi:thymidylate synthase
MNIEELSYLSLLKHILENGSKKEDRTGIGTLSVFGTQLRFSLENNKVPILTTKKMFLKGVIEELLFFLRGDIDTKKLEAKGVNIWKGNTSRAFLDKRGLKDLPEGDMGKGYGYQWRKFGGKTDQIKSLIQGLKNDPNSRRHLITAWNPNELDECALPPCHMMYQFYVDNNNLSLLFNMRSVDLFLGLPFNLLSYAALTHIVAKLTGLKAKELIFVGGDSHIYLNHLEQVKLQLSRTPYEFPELYIDKEFETIEEAEKLKFEDFRINNYKYYPAIKAEMAI